jgi:hypothetical protein
MRAVSVKQSALRMAAALMACAAVFSGAMPARATGAIACHALDGSEVSLTLGLGAAPVTPVLHLRAQIGAEAWSTAPGEAGRRWSLAQAFVETHWLGVDLVDEQSLERVATLRLLMAEEGGEIHRYGYLQLHGRAVHPIACIGP